MDPRAGRQLHQLWLRNQARDSIAEIETRPDSRIRIAFREPTEDLEAGLRQSLQALQRPLRPEEHPTPARRPPPLSIVMLVVGSRGDVQPFIPIGQRLQADGHRVRLATHAEFRGFVETHGLEFYPLAGDPHELMEYMVRTQGKLLPTRPDQLIHDVPRKRRTMREILDSSYDACTRLDPAHPEAEPFCADAIIANPPSYAHIHLAEALHLPLQIIFTMPWTPTTAFPHPLSSLIPARTPGIRNWLSYAAVDLLAWAGLGDLINDFRTKSLGLKALHPGEGGSSLLLDHAVPHTYLWPPGLLPKPDDWGPEIDLAGFVFLDQAAAYTPDAELQRFLEEGDPPLYIGFGSCVVDDPETLTRTILGAVERAGGRALLYRGWANLSSKQLPKGIRFVDDCPHDWLFPRCSTICHHGGAGTTAAALRAGKPSIIVPFFGDQHFWGDIIMHAGAGPTPLPACELEAEALAAAIQACREPKLRERAASLGLEVRRGDSALTAVQAFYRHLPQDAMACEGEDGRLATIWCEECRMALCEICDAAAHQDAIERDHPRLPYRYIDWAVPTRKYLREQARAAFDTQVAQFGRQVEDLAEDLRTSSRQGVALAQDHIPRELRRRLEKASQEFGRLEQSARRQIRKQWEGRKRAHNRKEETKPTEGGKAS